MQSTNDPRLLIGLGAVSELPVLTIRWPSGSLSRLEHLAPRKTYEVVEPANDGRAAVAVAHDR